MYQLKHLVEKLADLHAAVFAFPPKMRLLPLCAKAS